MPNLVAQLVTPYRYHWGFEREFESLYQEWRAAHEAAQPKFQIENIRFEHDPRWRYRFLSVTSARDGNHWVWRATKEVWFVLGGGV